MDLNCESPLIHGSFFSIVDTTVLKDPRLAESMGWGNLDTEDPCIRRADYKLYTDFQLHKGSAPLTPKLF